MLTWWVVRMGLDTIEMSLCEECRENSYLGLGIIFFKMLGGTFL